MRRITLHYKPTSLALDLEPKHPLCLWASFASKSLLFPMPILHPSTSLSDCGHLCTHRPRSIDVVFQLVLFKSYLWWDTASLSHPYLNNYHLCITGQAPNHRLCKTGQILDHHLWTIGKAPEPCFGSCLYLVQLNSSSTTSLTWLRSTRTSPALPQSKEGQIITADTQPKKSTCQVKLQKQKQPVSKIKKKKT